MADGSDSGDDDEGCKTGERPRSRRWLHLRVVSLEGIDDATARRVLSEHGRLVVHLARQYKLPARSHGPLTIEDLIAIGRVVLLQSWVEFDPARGAKFSTWAALILRQTFTYLIRESNARTSAHDRRVVLAPISFEELEHHGLDRMGGSAEALYQLTRDSIDHDPDLDARTEDRRRVAWLRGCIADLLTERERDVLFAVLEERKVEVGAKLQITRQRVEQIYTGAVTKLRDAARAEGLLDDDVGETRTRFLTWIRLLPEASDAAIVGAA